jgi:hypothetical protein
MDGEHHESDFYVDSFLNLDAMDEEISVEDLLAIAQSQQAQDPATLVQPQTAPIAQVFPDFQAAASDYVQHYSHIPAPPPVQHQQTLGKSSAYSFEDQMMTEAPIPHVHHPDGQAVRVQQQVQNPQAPVQHQQMQVP